MPDTPTPGQVAYTAYITCLRPDIATWTPPLYAGLDPANQAAWEAVAQAVRAHRMTDDISCPVCGAHDLASTPPGLTADGDVHRDMTCEDCAATWVCVYTFREVAYVQHASQEGCP